jgi:DNA-binding GntR family transcriptional regulator
MVEPRRHEVVAEALRERIRAGTHPAGSLLPATAALCRRFGVSASTVHKAIGALRAEGTVDSRQGMGVVVVARPPEPRRGITDALADIERDLARTLREVRALRDRLDTPDDTPTQQPP